VKKLSLLFMMFFVVVLSGCFGSGVDKKADSVVVGKELKPFTLNDQFDKPHTLTKDVKKIIFVAAKKSGHEVRNYFNSLPIDYLKKHHYVFVADVSGMPSIIYKLFAKSDLQKHKYPIWLIFDDKNSKEFKNDKKADEILLITLDNFVVKKVEYFKDIKSFEKAL